MLRLVSRSSRGLRYGVLALATVVVATSFTIDTADAKRKRSRHNVARVSYAPPFASIVVDANTGATLQATNADAQRHPASLTKIMTLYLLFEQIEAGKLKLNSEMEVSEHASEQAPTKLGVRAGSTLMVEDAIKGLVTRSANDAAAVIAEAISGDEEDFARLMTRKARALGMNKTVYRNASGLPDMEQVTTARDQAILGRAIQDRFPRYYRYFATESFRYKGKLIRGHNRLLGKVEGVDGIKTGYTRASGFNLVTSLKRDNRYVVAVVLGGRSGGSRDATMRNLLAENLPQGGTRRTVAMITERGGAEPAAPIRVASAARSAPVPAAAVQAEEPLDAEAASQPISESHLVPRGVASAIPPLATADPAPVAKPQPKAPPAPLTSGVISSSALPAIPGSEEPMKPVRVQTVQVKAGTTTRTAAAAPMRIVPSAPVETALEAKSHASAPITTAALPPAAETSQAGRTTVVQKSGAVMPVSAEEQQPRLPQRNPAHGTGQGILGVLPAHASTMASADPEQAIPAAPIGRTVIESPRTQHARVEPSRVETRRAEPASISSHASSAKPIIRTGWIVQVGALESEREARARLEAAREKASGLLGKADSFTETVAKGDKQLYRARFAGLDKDKAEAACRTLKRSDISCIAIKN